MGNCLRPSGSWGRAWALRQRDLDGCQDLWQGLPPHPLLPSEHHNILPIIPACITAQTQLTTHSKVQHLDKLQEARRIHGSQENQKGCSYILLLSLGQKKIHILIFRLLCVVFLLHSHSSAQSRECWAQCSISWAHIAMEHGTRPCL